MHLTSFGHQLVATSLVTLLQMIFCNCIEGNYYKNVKSKLFLTIEDDPIFVNKQLSFMYEKSEPYYLSAREINNWIKDNNNNQNNNNNNNNVPLNNNFQKKIENHKESFSANKTGSVVVIKIESGMLQRFLKFGIIVVEYLSSYNQMGVMKISAYESNIINNNNHSILSCEDYFPIRTTNEIIIDTLHKEKVSIAKTAQLKFDNYNNNNNFSSFYKNPFHLCVEIIKTKPVRKGNKISIFAFTLF